MDPFFQDGRQKKSLLWRFWTTVGLTDSTPDTGLPVGVWNACVEFKVGGANGSGVTWITDAQTNTDFVHL